MWYRIAADAVLVLHFLFVLFVALGALLVLRWPRLAWVQIPVAIYGAAIELVGWICPLTPLENRLRALGGEAGYEGGFVERYITAAIYPEGLSRGVTIALGVLVIATNAAIYLVVLRRQRRRRRETGAREGT